LFLLGRTGSKNKNRSTKGENFSHGNRCFFSSANLRDLKKIEGRLSFYLKYCIAF
jgi:hypothetical protein